MEDAFCMGNLIRFTYAFIVNLITYVFMKTNYKYRYTAHDKAI